MIRFSCTTCGRDYVLADALRHLPLLCKRCGQRLVVPDPQVEAPVAVQPAIEEAAAHVPAPAVPLPPPSITPPESPAPLATPSAPEPAAKTPPRRAVVVAADASAVAALLAIGVFLGEAATGESTGAILANAGSAPKFPPTNLVLWLACVGFFPLVYAWLNGRGWTLGGWLKRRRG